MTAEHISIGQLASTTGLAVSAVRFYDETGLIAASTRVGGKRRFDPTEIGRVNFIQRCKDAGFTLDEIRAILDDTSGEWRQTVEAKRAELIAKRNRLNETIDLLAEVRTCGCEVVATCRRESEH